MSTPSRLRLRLFPRAETAVRRGHPWVFADSIKDQDRQGQPGELAIIYDRRDRFMAIGLYDPHSPIRVRIVHAGSPATVDADWWRKKMAACMERRSDLISRGDTNGMRLVNGESEGFPGMVVDAYAETRVVKVYTAAWLPRWPEMQEMIRELLGGSHLVLRLSRNIQQIARDNGSITEGFCGAPGDDIVTFTENGIRFEAAVRHGQKTGFFLDQRENRERVESIADGRDVLNVFSFSGAFSLYAARGGAISVTDLDISGHALESASRNYDLNRDEPRIQGVARHQVQADAFEWLAQTDARYDLIVTDPPSLAKRQLDKPGALRAYESINRSAVERLRARGILVAASCSAHVTTDEFYSLVEDVARKSGRSWRECWRSGHALDHPATFAEASYLKAIALEFD